MTLGQRLEFGLARVALGLVRRLSPAAASDLGGLVGRAVGPWLPVSAVAARNLRLALPALDAAARRRTIRGVWDNLGRTVAELPHLPALEHTSSGPGWEIAGEAHIRALAAAGGPAILFSGHLGNWEILPRVALAFGVPVAGMYRAPANPAVDRLIGELRQAALGRPLPMFAKGAGGGRAALAHLRAGGFLALLMDQKLNDGLAVPFFGHPAMTAPALALFARRLRCPVVPAHVERLGPARFRVVCEAPLEAPLSADEAADVLALTGSVNARLEAWIRARPEAWLWLHRRWPKETMDATPQ